jgi:hypothetical protein
MENGMHGGLKKQVAPVIIAKRRPRPGERQELSAAWKKEIVPVETATPASS